MTPAEILRGGAAIVRRGHTGTSMYRTLPDGTKCECLISALCTADPRLGCSQAYRAALDGLYRATNTHGDEIIRWYEAHTAEEVASVMEAVAASLTPAGLETPGDPNG